MGNHKLRMNIEDIKNEVDLSKMGKDENDEGDDVEIKAKYRSLKKKYALLLQEYKKVVVEFEKSTQDLNSLNTEKNFLRNQINDLLKAKGVSVNDHPKCCLLYTSPSPRDRQKSRMPSSA
eukprot:TRINITY_DN1565_c0_g1_i4.p1 TRINITY_DN1565_c0_g1~~TRINITY_DN1565_c0_g1_i4.p1  ORF type:complete len:120 (-),score=32.25 TRINITY_DN1565_c0_g1_i4:11-370(-)